MYVHNTDRRADSSTGFRRLETWIGNAAVLVPVYALLIIVRRMTGQDKDAPPPFKHRCGVLVYVKGSGSRISYSSV